MADGGRTVVLLNRSAAPAQIAATWPEIGYPRRPRRQRPRPLGRQGPRQAHRHLLRQRPQPRRRHAPRQTLNQLAPRSKIKSPADALKRVSWAF